MENLPVKANLVPRCVIDNACCHMCYMNEEDATHIFFQCNFARRVWSFFDDQRIISHDLSAKGLICAWLRTGSLIVLQQVFLLMWAIWSARNKVLWCNPYPHPRSVLRHAKALGAQLETS